jgi:WD40 repeat protein
VTASEDRIARVWEAETGALIAELQGHRGEVYSATFSSDGTRIVTTSGDKTARLWSVPRCQALIDAARRDLPHDLSAAERDRYFLEDRPLGTATRIYANLRSWFVFALPQVGERCF